MAITQLTNGQRDQFALHIDDLSIPIRAGEGPGEVPASYVANQGFSLFEVKAGGFPSTNRNIGVQENDTLSTPEINQLAAAVNALTAQVEGDDGTGADVANEFLQLLEERYLLPNGGRDVTQEQLP